MNSENNRHGVAARHPSAIMYVAMYIYFLPRRAFLLLHSPLPARTAEEERRKRTAAA